MLWSVHNCLCCIQLYLWLEWWCITFYYLCVFQTRHLVNNLLRILMPQSLYLTRFYNIVNFCIIPFHFTPDAGKMVTGLPNRFSFYKVFEVYKKEQVHMLLHLLDLLERESYRTVFHICIAQRVSILKSIFVLIYNKK